MTEHDRQLAAMRHRLQACESARCQALARLEGPESLLSRQTADLPLSTALAVAVLLRDVRRILTGEEVGR